MKQYEFGKIEAFVGALLLISSLACVVDNGGGGGGGGGGDAMTGDDTMDDNGGDQDTSIDREQPDPSDCNGTLEGPIEQDMTISPGDGCRLVESVVQVNAHLTIEPGVTLLFDQDAGLSVKGGSLTADGTGDEILFTGIDETPGYWRGLQYNDTKRSDNVLKNVAILYAGGSSFDSAESAGLALNSSGAYGAPVSVTVENVTVNKSGGYGMYTDENTEFRSFSNNVFSGNEGAAARVTPNLMGVLDGGSTYSGNSDDYVKVVGGSFKEGDHVWSNIDAPYRLESNVAINGEAHVDIDAGATFEFAADAALKVEGGTMSANGEEGDKITFTSTDETPGFWSGVEYNNTKSSKNKLKHAVIEYAGGSSVDSAESAGLILNSSGAYGAALTVSIENVEVSNSGNFGMYTDSNTNISSFKNNEFTNNEGAAVRITPNLVGDLDQTSSFAGNSDEYVRVTSGSFGDGEHTWSNIDVPYRFAGNVGINGDAHVDIEAGATLEFDADAAFKVVGGTMSANGKDGNEVVFTSSDPTPGFWSGVEYNETNSSKNKLEEVKIKYAAGASVDSADPAGLILNSSGAYGAPLSIDLNGVEITDFDNAAVFVQGGTTLRSCSNLSGFGSGDVIGEEQAVTDFNSQCGL